MPQHLKMLYLDKLKRLEFFFSIHCSRSHFYNHRATSSWTHQTTPPEPHSPQNPRSSPWLTNTITNNGLIVAFPRPVLASPKNPPIPPPNYLLPTLPELVPRVMPYPRVLPPPLTSPKPPADPRVPPPRQSPSLVTKAPRVETVSDNEDEEDTKERRRSANASSHNTRNKNKNVHSIYQEEMISCVDVSQFTLSPYTIAS